VWLVVRRLAQFQRSAVLQACGQLSGALVGYREILLRARDGGDVPADAAWNCAVIIQQRGQSTTDLLEAIEYTRLARAFYQDPSNAKCNTNMAHCTHLIDQLAQKLVGGFQDIVINDRAERCSPLPQDHNLATEIEEAWAHAQRLHCECHSERVRVRAFPQILDIATHLIQIDPRGRYPTTYLYHSTKIICIYFFFRFFVCFFCAGRCIMCCGQRRWRSRSESGSRWRRSSGCWSSFIRVHSRRR